ncbi:flexible cuticle protein 12-like [Aricia agestis]|uniref:flexible cuticle protein 12-like n=1 Tax=Aricia agestis TaxID=91739 RepID=UPI001C20A66D|nr:flexible cuticle protein 12-like [Aricia agestis]
MKSFIVLAVLVAAALAAPLDSDKDAVVVRSDLENIGVEGFQWNYQTSNGIAAQEQARLEQVGTENEGIEVQGQYSYVGPDGVTYTVTYTAGRAGFQPSGAHIPQ